MSGPPTGGAPPSDREPAPPWGPAARAVALAVLPRPRLWPVAATTLWRLARPGWWRTAPHLPLPDPGYWHFRLVTAYGGAGTQTPSAADIVTYLHWCRGMRAARG